MNFDVLYRVDERLIHGQVIVGWARAFNVKNIFVADSEAAENQIEVTLMNMATPDDLELLIKSPRETAEVLNKFNFKKNKSIVLFKNFKSVYECVDALGVLPEKINVGGIYFDPEKEKILDCLYVSKEDKEFIRLLTAKNIKIIVQTLPSSQPVDINDIMCG